MNGSPHFKDVSFPTGEEERTELLESYFKKYFMLDPPEKKRLTSLTKTENVRNRSELKS
jgi:DNA-binding cell septation regulator SpoVG